MDGAEEGKVVSVFFFCITATAVDGGILDYPRLLLRL